MAARPTGIADADTMAIGVKARYMSSSTPGSGSLDLGRNWIAAAAPSPATGASSSANALFARPPTLATGGGDGKVKVWTDEGWVGGGAEALGGDGIGGSANSAGGCVGSTGHEGAVLSVCWHPQGEMIASAGQDWAIWLWDAEGRALSYLHTHRRWTQALTFSGGGDFLVSCGGAGFEGWVVGVDGRDGEVALCWRQPPRLFATLAQVREKGIITFLFYGLGIARIARKRYWCVFFPLCLLLGEVRPGSQY